MTLDEQIEALKKWQRPVQGVGLGWKVKQMAIVRPKVDSRLEELRRIAEGVV